MKNQSFRIIQIILLLGFFGCQTKTANFEKISFGECLTYFYIGNSKDIDYEKELIIQTDKDYNLFKIYCDSITPKIGDYKCEFPKINFNKFDLIGKCVKAKGCENEVTTNLIIEEQNKQYLFEIDIESSGNCNSSGFIMNYYIVPKPPTNYSYAFNVLN